MRCSLSEVASRQVGFLDAQVRQGVAVNGAWRSNARSAQVTGSLELSVVVDVIISVLSLDDQDLASDASLTVDLGLASSGTDAHSEESGSGKTEDGSPASLHVSDCEPSSGVIDSAVPSQWPPT